MGFRPWKCAQPGIETIGGERRLHGRDVGPAVAWGISQV
jgi:hypothetical protein